MIPRSLARGGPAEGGRPDRNETAREDIEGIQIEALALALAGLGRGAAVLVGAALATYVGVKYVQRRRFIRSVRIARITPEELLDRMQGGEPMMIVDLRNLDHLVSEGLRVPGALHMDPADLERRHREIPRDQEIALYCS